MLAIVIVFLSLSILLYLLLGGADFGAGIIELFSSSQNRKTTRKLTYQAIGPIWEANHMWLIITIVILFVGFPSIYTAISIHLHIPLLIMLFGIIARGTAFIFRHYDAVKDDMQKIYNDIFVSSSFITPLFLGIIAGSLIGGQINPSPNNFYEGFIAPWFNVFAFSVGLFTVGICSFLASIYLIGEADNSNDEQVFIRKAISWNTITLLSGALVFIIAKIQDIKSLLALFKNPLSLTAFILAIISLGVLWYFLFKRKKFLVRILAGFQVSMIMFAVGYEYFPNFVMLNDGKNLSLLSTAAHDSSIAALGWALIIGSVFILPSLFYLYYRFQVKETGTIEH
jgi:cytochrome d ubiquinol oxidase subunit II